MTDTLLKDAAPFEIAMAHVWDTFGRHAYRIEQIKHIGVTYTPDDWMPILVWDLGLEEIVPYVTEMQAALTEGPEWQRKRGTEAGILIGLGWVDATITIDVPDQRHDWWQFQIELTVPAQLDHLQNITAVAKLSKAAEDELFRLHTPQGDLRPIRRDYHSRDHGRRDGYSGVVLWPGGPLVSMVDYHLVPVSTPDTNGLISAVIVVTDVLVMSGEPEASLTAMLPMATAEQLIGWPEYYGDGWARSYSAQSQILTPV